MQIADQIIYFLFDLIRQNFVNSFQNSSETNIQCVIGFNRYLNPETVSTTDTMVSVSAQP